MTTTNIQIRFADCDMGEHVHNAAYLHYFEQARMDFFVKEIPQWDWKKTGFILKKNIVEYHIPTVLTDKIHVEVNCIHLGNKSFTLSYHVKDAKQRLMAYGESVVVCFDYTQQLPISIPEELVAILKQHMITQ